MLLGVVGGEEGTMAASDAGAVARQIIDANLYMVLATADASGRPWATPVYFANAGYDEFFWVSSPERKHSRNIAARPQVGIVVFDSSVPIGTGQGVYMEAVAEEVTGAELERGIEVFSRRSLATGGGAWTPGDVQGAAGLRLYRATASEHSILAKDGTPDHRIAADVAAPER
jgi:pyridoxine/pyridoxamine 5'-phosphate oxidase